MYTGKIRLICDWVTLGFPSLGWSVVCVLRYNGCICGYDSLIQGAAEITPTFGGVTARAVKGLQWWEEPRWLVVSCYFQIMPWVGQASIVVSLSKRFSKTMNLWSRHKEHSVGTSDFVDVLPFQIEKDPAVGFEHESYWVNIKTETIWPTSER